MQTSRWESRQWCRTTTTACMLLPFKTRIGGAMFEFCVCGYMLPTPVHLLHACALSCPVLYCKHCFWQLWILRANNNLICALSH